MVNGLKRSIRHRLVNFDEAKYFFSVQVLFDERHPFSVRMADMPSFSAFSEGKRVRFSPALRLCRR
jgi:hypothetical protein